MIPSSNTSINELAHQIALFSGEVEDSGTEEFVTSLSSRAHISSRKYVSQ
ncbi:MAG: hypothetical protein OSA11_02065 [Candidatus Nanopelagicales bacterium]|nr:hypothetical protein [Candidatus Nanopelagicales bacterium]